MAVSFFFIFHARPISFRYTSHMTTMFEYQTPTRHAPLAVQKGPYICDFGTAPQMVLSRDTTISVRLMEPVFAPAVSAQLIFSRLPTTVAYYTRSVAGLVERRNETSRSMVPVISWLSTNWDGWTDTDGPTRLPNVSSSRRQASVVVVVGKFILSDERRKPLHAASIWTDLWHIWARLANGAAGLIAGGNFWPNDQIGLVLGLGLGLGIVLRLGWYAGLWHTHAGDTPNDWPKTPTLIVTRQCENTTEIISHFAKHSIANAWGCSNCKAKSASRCLYYSVQKLSRCRDSATCEPLDAADVQGSTFSHTPLFFLSKIQDHNDPGCLRHAGSQDTDLFCVITIHQCYLLIYRQTDITLVAEAHVALDQVSEHGWSQDALAVNNFTVRRQSVWPFDLCTLLNFAFNCYW